MILCLRHFNISLSISLRRIPCETLQFSCYNVKYFCNQISKHLQNSTFDITRWWLRGLRGEDISAKHVKFSFIWEGKDVNSRGVNLVVGDVDEPGAEETSPANSQHYMDMVRGQIMVNAVDILNSHSFSNIESSLNGQTDDIPINDYYNEDLYYRRNMMKKMKK